MNGPRSLANHSRYLATLQMEAWQRALSDDNRPGWIVDAAFAPAVRWHLRQAYGWLLLAAARVAQAPPQPPHSVSELPGLAPGIAMSAELVRCEDLETDGWLSDMLAPLPTASPPPRQSNLLATKRSTPDLDQYRLWAEALDKLLESIDLTLDES
jgi:hypothetical protein